MDFKEAAYNVIERNFEDGNFIPPHQCDALGDHTGFLNAIPDSDKEKIAQKLFDEIVEFNGDIWNYWTTTPPTAKPTRVITSELKTVNAFLELLNKIYVDVPSTLTKGFFSIDKDYSNAKNYAQKIKHDLEILSKKTKQSDLLVLQKGRYYSNIKLKEDVENIIRDIMKDYSIPIDYLSIQEVRAFIARF